MSDAQRYHDLDDSLAAVGGETRAAEAHGLLCGMLCGPRRVEASRWIAQVLEGASPRGEAARECLEGLTALYEETRHALDDDELDFQPLLPGDDEPLPERARALGRWCEGFLLGLGFAGAGEGNELPREAAEVVTDLGQIARIDPDADAGEENEQAYTELVEYLRVAALLVHEHGAVRSGASRPSERGADRLH